jgi:hypothetical protein
MNKGKAPLLRMSASNEDFVIAVAAYGRSHTTTMDKMPQQREPG